MSGRACCDHVADRVRMVARAEVAGDDQLVLEPVAALHQVVEVHVAELVDLLLAMVGRDERQLQISTSASYMAGQASRPGGELSPR